MLLRAFAIARRARARRATLDRRHGPRRARAARARRRARVSDAVALHGQLGRRSARPRARHGWVHAVPSRWPEPFGLTATEAMMRGTAVVASEVGGLADIVAPRAHRTSRSTRATSARSPTRSCASSPIATGPKRSAAPDASARASTSRWTAASIGSSDCTSSSALRPSTPRTCQLIARSGPVVLLGFDAADPDLVERWAREGKLPAMADLMARGTWARTSRRGAAVRARHLVHAAVRRLRRAPRLPLLLAAGARQLRARAEARTRPRRRPVLGASSRGATDRCSCSIPPTSRPVPGVRGLQVSEWATHSHYPPLDALRRAGVGGRRGAPRLRPARADRREDRRVRRRGSLDRGPARRARGT